MTFTFGIFINISFGMAVIDERARAASFSPVIKLIFLLLSKNVR
jgi:hypothetical protein